MVAWEHQIFNAAMYPRSTVKYISVNMKHGCQKRDEVTQKIPRLNKTPAFSPAAGWEQASFSRVPCFSPAVCKTLVPSSLSFSLARSLFSLLFSLCQQGKLWRVHVFSLLRWRYNTCSWREGTRVGKKDAGGATEFVAFPLWRSWWICLFGVID